VRLVVAEIRLSGQVVTVAALLGWAGHLPDHLADLAARAPKLKNVTVVAPWTT
jgi:hypothetical protein